MSSDVPDTPTEPGDRIDDVRVEEEMEQSYIDYAMSVIAGRALPDVRDGLKPVHRRILYAMHRSGVTSGSGHRKSSSVVGETMGDFHPHGDSAIYDTLVRMAQEFSMRYPMIDGQGNFGSVDGDPPAAMRYTEARMAPIAEEFLEDIEKDTVDFESNYDDRLEEPAVLPAKVPGLLVNGSSGIAVGMSTNVPPHNLSEVVEATIHLIENPDCNVLDLVDTREFDDEGNLLHGSDGPIEGPDFPTGAKIVGREPIYSAYETGRGRIRVRADYDVLRGEDRIVVNEIPFQANKSRMVEKIADFVNDGEIEGISDLRDESDRDGIRVVIELKRGANADVVENQLLERVFERTFGVINLALVDGQPEVLDLKETLEHYLDHRKSVVRRRSEYELEEAEDRAHILEGRLKALENADAVVETIQDADDRDAAKDALGADFGFSEAQAEHIVRMQLGSLTAMEGAEIETEYEGVTDRIERLEEILANESELLGVITNELREIEAEYGDERRTDIEEGADTRRREDLIPEEDVVVVVTEDDYIKRTLLSEFRAQNRGGKGIIGADPKEGDRVSTVFQASTHDYLLCFTNHGQVYRLKVYDIPEMGRTARGTSAVNVLDLDDGEEIESVVATDDLDEGAYLTTVTKNGYVKRTPVSAYENILSTGIIATKLEDGDELTDVVMTDGNHDLVIATREGMSIRFAEEEVRSMGRNARGVHGIAFEDGDRVAGVTAVGSDSEWTLTVTKNGYGKRTEIDQYRLQSRNGKGLIDIKTGDRNGPVCSIETVCSGDHLVAMTEAGQIIRAPIDDVSIVGRNTKGVIVMEVDSEDRLANVDVVPSTVAE
ncbi:MAG: DNA gyrase subunit A [Halobacteriales archaeon]